MTSGIYPIAIDRLLTEEAAVHEPGVRPGAVDFVLRETAGLTGDAARLKLRELNALYRWNAATQGAALRAIRRRDGGP